MSSIKSKTALFGASAIAALSMGFTAAHAQDAAAGAQTRDQIGDIVVTARKESEQLQTTPVAVTALNTESLAQNQIAVVTDLQKAAPSLATSTGGPGGPGVSYLSLRGQVNNGANSASDSAVATYVNGVNWARATSGNFGFLDLAQVEILRGPQGTLFGRNTTGGALNITTTQPTGEFGGYVLGGVGNYGSKKIEGAVTLPLQGDQLSLRVAARYENRDDGYFDNPLTGEEVSDLERAAVGRATLKWAPENLPLTLTLEADASDWKDNGQGSAVRAINTAAAPALGISVGTFFAARGLNPNDYIVGGTGTGKWDQTYGLPNSGYAEIDTPNDDGQNAGLAATLDVDFGSWNLKSITAWRKADANNSLDLDGTPVRLIAFASQYRQDQYSEELQATTHIGNLDLIGGLFAFKEEGTEQSTSSQFGAIGDVFTAPLVFPSALSRDRSDFEATSQAAFVQANYQFTDKLRGTAGYRYTWDNRKITRHGLSSVALGTCATVGVVPPGCDEPYDADFEYPAWTVGLDYKVTDNIFTYIKSSEASMAGGFNTRPAPAGQQAFQPEKLTDVEVGLKVDALDKRLRANLAVYRSEGESVQRNVSAVIGGRSTQYTTNAGDTENTGVELEVTALPWSGMQVTAGAAYLDSSYKAGTFLETQLVGGLPVVVDRSGETVPQAPEWAFNVSATQDFDLSYGVLSIHADYSWTDDKAILVGTAAPGSSAAAVAQQALANELGTLPSYGLINGRVSLAMSNGLEVALWGRNLGDEEYYTYVFQLYSAGFATGPQGAPMTFGLDVKYAF